MEGLSVEQGIVHLSDFNRPGQVSKFVMSSQPRSSLVQSPGCSNVSSDL